jgi:hypothetical protein
MRIYVDRLFLQYRGTRSNHCKAIHSQLREVTSMGRDGADSDWQRENGMAYWEGGEYNFPSSWDRDAKVSEVEIFDTFEEAKTWSLANGGKPFVRSSNGHGFIPKGKK